MYLKDLKHQFLYFKLHINTQTKEGRWEEEEWGREKRKKEMIYASTMKIIKSHCLLTAKADPAWHFTPTRWMILNVFVIP